MLWNDSGYFDNAAETKPLLYLWSLGIEKQFHIVWPLLLWWIRTLSKQSEGDHVKVFQEQLKRTIQSLRDHSKKVIVIMQIPELDYDISRCLAGRPIKITRVVARCEVPVGKPNCISRSTRTISIPRSQVKPASMYGTRLPISVTTEDAFRY
jgi:SGNH domain (fused to AT3 domains)